MSDIQDFLIDYRRITKSFFNSSRCTIDNLLYACACYVRTGAPKRLNRALLLVLG